MAKSIQDLKTSFELVDTNKDGLINDAELNAALVSAGITVKKEEADLFVKTAGRSRSGQINFDEYELLARFYESPLKTGNFFLIGMAESIYQFGQALESTNSFHCPDSKIKIHISDQESKHAKFPSSLTFLAGEVKSNHHLAKVITDSCPSPLAFIINVGVKNGEQIVAELNERLSSFKAVLSEISKEAKDVLDLVDFSVISTKIGVQIIIDFSKHSVFEVYSKIVNKYMEVMEKHPLPFYFQAQSDVDFDNEKIPLSKFVEDVFSIDFQSTYFSFGNLLNHSDYKQTLKGFVDTKSGFAPLMTLIATIKSFNFIMNLDHKMRADLTNKVNEASENSSIEKLVVDTCKLINDNDGYDFLEMFEDAKEIIRILKKNETTHAGFFLKIHNHYVGLDFRMSAYKNLNKLLKLENEEK